MKNVAKSIKKNDNLIQSIYGKLLHILTNTGILVVREWQVRAQHRKTCVI